MKRHIYLSRRLRRRETETEKIFWSLVRNSQFEDKRFVRQYPIYVKEGRKRKLFILDFYCPANKLAIELDGKIHERQREYDKYRTECLNTEGIQVIRFTNEEVLNSPGEVLTSLQKTLNSLSRQKRGKEALMPTG
jgi:very-short-patch-repair endonuclease